MPNTSATGGYLDPAVSPAPLEGQDLNRFLQQVVVGVTGLDGTLVRPRWQTVPSNIPQEATAWAAVGVLDRPSDTFPFVGHDVDGEGTDLLIRNETLSVQVSFYDTGTNGQADKFCALFRDGLSIAQNREVLLLGGMVLNSVGTPQPVPSLMKQRWLYRVDLPIIIIREIRRVYPVLNLLSMTGTLYVDNGLPEMDISVDNP